MDGFNVQTHLARKCAALPVIIVTGHDFPKARERAMAGGASAFLRKPVHDRTLLDAIFRRYHLRYQMKLTNPYETPLTPQIPPHPPRTLAPPRSPQNLKLPQDPPRRFNPSDPPRSPQFPPEL